MVESIPTRDSGGIGVNSHQKDFESKLNILRTWLATKRADGLMLTTVTNFAWLTHGRSFVSIASEQSVAKVLITSDRVVLMTTNNEAPRLEKEEVAGWGLEWVVRPWSEGFEQHWQSQPWARQEVLWDRDVEAELSTIRQRLSEYERHLLLQLGTDSADLLEQFALDLKPGSRENEMAGDLARAAWSAGMEPLVLNMATDERAFAFRHALPTTRKLERYGVLSVCFRRFGLHVTLTRSVHFGPVPGDLADRHRVACALEASAQAASLAGTTVGSVVGSVLEDYKTMGWVDEWKQHPIGGCLGFLAREFDVTPENRSTLFAGQGFCWNPTILGTKSEQTFLVGAEGPIVVTAGHRFPLLKVSAGGREFERPDILRK
jgi:Xaa-Pro aminopeptidase